jgi:hypothetical protein
MIVQSFESKRKPTVYQVPAAINDETVMPWFSEREKYQAKMRGISTTEYVRREQIVKDLFAGCTYQAGDTLYPTRTSDFKKYGACRVLGICTSYMYMDKDEAWPKNDNPLIVTFQPLTDPKTTMFCTVNYLTDKMPVEETC